MFRRALDKHLQRRDDEVWAAAESAWHEPLTRVNWLHALSEAPTVRDGWIRSRGVLLLADRFLFFDDWSGRPGVISLQRVVKLDWIEGYERVLVTFADPFEVGIARQQGYDFAVEGQQGRNADLLKDRFAHDLQRCWDAIPEPSDEELWPGQ